jgi:hypothetical protein
MLKSKSSKEWGNGGKCGSDAKLRRNWRTRLRNLESAYNECNFITISRFATSPTKRSLREVIKSYEFHAL